MAGRTHKPTTPQNLVDSAEPKPERTAPEMPKGMPPAARREWRSLVPILLQIGVLSNIDGKALAAYCDAYAHWEKARKEIARYGVTLKTPKTDKEGSVIYVTDEVNPDKPVRMLYEFKQNPAVSAYKTFLGLMKSYLVEFGLTPASRAKLKVQAQADQDLLAQLAQGGTKPSQLPAFFDTGKREQPEFTKIPAKNAQTFDA